MPNGPLTFLDLVKLQTTPGYDLVEENVRLSPELEVVPADVMAATEISLSVRTDLPGVNFSNIGEGAKLSKSGTLTRLFQLAYLDALVSVDVRLLNGKPTDLQGRLLSGEQSGYVESAIRTMGKQFWYGVGNDKKGFPGLIAQGLTDTSHVIDAGGTTAAKSSIFFTALGRNKAEFWFGNNRALEFDDWFQGNVLDVAGNPYEAENSWMHCSVGARLGNRNAFVRIKNITAEDGKTATYELMHQALRQMRDDLGQIPTHIFMTGRSQEQLRQCDKTALNPNPPLPTAFEGIPILPSHNISNAETI
ncbi:MAG: major capsid protein [Chthoniobacteraceae bacterium]